MTKNWAKKIRKKQKNFANEQNSANEQSSAFLRNCHRIPHFADNSACVGTLSKMLNFPAGWGLV